MTDADPPLPIKDVVDFYARWPELRPYIVDMTQRTTISETDADILNWLVAVVDMVGPLDLAQD